jgi:hypothetical protein
MITIPLVLYVFLWVICVASIFCQFLEYYGHLNRVTENVFKISYYVRIVLNLAFIVILLNFQIPVGM